MKIQCECGCDKFQEHFQIENLDKVSVINKFVVCTRCLHEVDVDIPKQEYTLREYSVPDADEPEIRTYEVSYQQEAFPWDRWSIAETTRRTHPLYEVYKDHSSGITEVLCVLVEADNRLDAKIAGGTILMEYMRGKAEYE